MSQTLTVVILSAAVASAAGIGTALLLGAPRDARAGTSEEAALERIADQLADLAARQGALEDGLKQLELSADEPQLVNPGGPARLSQGEIEAAVARYMQGLELDAVGTVAAVDAPAAASLEDRVAAALEELSADGLSDLDRQALWRRFAEEGLSDEIVAAYEALAERSPNDPDAQVQLAGAYLNKIFEVGNSPEAGLWATKADKAFDRALELDDQHWDARFSKAVSLSFWPPVFGKQGEAIQQFERLVQQQASLPPEDRYAQTHLLLGNMYTQIGEEDQAAAAWRRGLELYPDNAELMGQLEVFSKAE